MSAMAETEQLEGTRGRILEELAVAPRTARDLARTLGIQESAARGHLGRLEERGLVIPSFRREGVGRSAIHFMVCQPRPAHNLHSGARILRLLAQAPGVRVRGDRAMGRREKGTGLQYDKMCRI